MRRLSLLLLVIACLATLPVFAQQHPGSKIADTPQWEKLKTLTGDWDGYVMFGDKKMQSHVSVRMTGDGSALMHWMDSGTSHEMITMFHPDGQELLVTHYCAAHNQPRMRLVSGADLNKLVFDFKDGTNIAPGDTYMRKVAIVFLDADHHDEEWTSDNGGTMNTAVFHFTRSSAGPKS